MILDVISMHCMFGLHEIFFHWFRSVRSSEQPPNSWLKMPLPLIGQFLREGINLQFHEVSSIKNYYGEKIGFLYAWTSFYISWLMIPATAGLTLTIY